MDAPRELCLLGPQEEALHRLHDAIRRTLAERGLSTQWRMHLAPAMASQPAPLCLLLAAPPDDPAAWTAEQALRQTLHARQWAYRVLHPGSTPLLDAALLAMGLEVTDPAQQTRRSQAQFDLDRGRVPWRCERCSDAGCEHTLFTRLTQAPGSQ